MQRGVFNVGVLENVCGLAIAVFVGHGLSKTVNVLQIRTRSESLNSNGLNVTTNRDGGQAAAILESPVSYAREKNGVFWCY